MNVTDVRVKLARDREDKLQAFAAVTLDGTFVVRDIKVIKGASGYFIAMPSRKLTARCHVCGAKNHLRARYCNRCGKHQKQPALPLDERGRAKLHADICHPITQECRAMLEVAIVQRFTAELEAAKQPDYQPAADEPAGFADLADAGPEEDDV